MASAASSSIAVGCVQIDSQLDEPGAKICGLNLDAVRDLHHPQLRSHRRSATSKQINKVHTDINTEYSISRDLGVYTDPEGDRVRNEYLSCETPKAKRHKCTGDMECPPAPRKPRPKRIQRELAAPGGYFFPADLDVLPVHIKALFG